MLQFLNQCLLALFTVYIVLVLSNDGKTLIKLLVTILFAHVLSEASEVASVQINHVVLLLL